MSSRLPGRSYRVRWILPALGCSSPNYIRITRVYTRVYTFTRVYECVYTDWPVSIMIIEGRTKLKNSAAVTAEKCPAWKRILNFGLICPTLKSCCNVSSFLIPTYNFLTQLISLSPHKQSGEYWRINRGQRGLRGTRSKHLSDLHFQ